MTIVTTLELPARVRAILEPAGQLVGPDQWERELPRADALITLLTVRVDHTLLERAPRLRIVANAVVGYDNVDVEACRARGVVVTNTPDVLTDATADLAVALMLAAVRRLPQAERSLRAGGFRGWGFWDYLGGDLTGATLGILGMGRIGQATARRAAAFGMQLQYCNRQRLVPEVESSLGARFVDWETLLTTSDVLSLHAPASAETRHILDAAALRRMKRGSYLVNTARGALVDEAALVDALRDGHLAGAGLDVYEREPEVHPGLLELDNVVLLPHIGSATIGTRERMAMLAARNVHSVLTGGEPITPVMSRG
jgi:glyoxylate reductase